MDAPTRFSRRSLLRGKINKTPVFRPPWSLPEKDFLDQCQRCGDCISVCETGLLTAGSGGFPEAHFEQAGCSFCNACVLSCPHGALIKNKPQPWFQKPAISTGCLALQQVHCRTCSDFCETEAISFLLKPGGVAKPIIDTELCSGCGECIASCPVKALSMNNEEITDASATR